MEIPMTEETTPNPTFAQAETELYHAGEAPPAGHAFFPVAYCGTAMTGQRYDRKSDLPEGARLCATDAKHLGIDQPEEKKIATPDKPEVKSPVGSDVE
jgi:hypothetical protein